MIDFILNNLETIKDLGALAIILIIRWLEKRNLKGKYNAEIQALKDELNKPERA